MHVYETYIVIIQVVQRWDNLIKRTQIKYTLLHKHKKILPFLCNRTVSQRAVNCGLFQQKSLKSKNNIIITIAN